MLENRFGFTLIELLLVIGLLAILAAATTPFLSRFLLQTHFDATVEQTTMAVKIAQNNAMNTSAQGPWGVCLVPGKIRVYSGSCGTPTSSEEFLLVDTATVSGFTDIVFSSRGEPTTVCTLTIQSSLEMKSITINAAGGIE